jgi:feruloyl-CoA synthase
VFVQDGEVYARSLAALDLPGVLLVHVDRAPPQMQSLHAIACGGAQFI